MRLLYSRQGSRPAWSLPTAFRPYGLRLYGIEKITDWLCHQAPVDLSRSSVLDYGCGNFDLGRQIKDRARLVVGYDPNYPQYAKKPDGKYDVIVVNSVIQYFSDDAELDEFLVFSRQLLKSDRSFIVISDLMPTRYSFGPAALRSLKSALRRKQMLSAALAIAQGVLRQCRQPYYRIDFESLRERAKRCGLSASLLPENLTAATDRYSVILS